MIPPPATRRVCVYCASNDGVRPEYASAARTVGRLLAERGEGLVYGGGRAGLMGAVADASLAAGGEAIGVMPFGLVEREVAHRGLTRLETVDSMHERKARMLALSDAFLALPGGIGTLEELFETWSWAGLGVHAKPIGVLNVAGFWDPLLALLDHAAREGFLRGQPADWLVVDDDPARLLTRLERFSPPSVRQWLTRAET